LQVVVPLLIRRRRSRWSGWRWNSWAWPRARNGSTTKRRTFGRSASLRGRSSAKVNT